MASGGRWTKKGERQKRELIEKDEVLFIGGRFYNLFLIMCELLLK